MKKYEDLILKIRANLLLKDVEKYVRLGEVTWEQWRDDRTKYYAKQMEIGEKEDELDLEPMPRGRPVEYPESKFHQYNRDIQKKFRDKKKMIEQADNEGREVRPELREKILSKIGELRLINVSPGMGRLTKELGDVERWEVEYAVKILIREEKLTVKGRNILIR